MSIRERVASARNALTDLRYYQYDSVTLVDSAVVEDGLLRDLATGAQVRLNGTAAELVKWLRTDGPLQVSQMADRLQELLGCGAELALSDCTALVAVLDRAAVIEVGGADSFTVGLRDAWKTRGASLLNVDTLRLARGGRRRRYPATGAGVAKAVARSQGVVAVIGLLLCVFLGIAVGVAYEATDFLNKQTVDALVIGPAVLGLAHLGILFVHEWGHLSAARILGLRPAYVFSEGRKVGMVRPRGGRVALALVSLAGPILASLAALTAVAAIQVVSPGYWVTSPSGMASSCLLLYAVGHLLSLAPIAADGRNLARAIMGPKGGGPKCKTAGTEREDGREN